MGKLIHLFIEVDLGLSSDLVYIVHYTVAGVIIILIFVPVTIVLQVGELTLASEEISD